MILVLSVWHLFIVKYFQLEISEHVISIKYGHPFSKTFNFPVLEIPVEKVSSCKIEKGLINSFLVINIHSKRGIKSFYYRLGILSEKQTDNFKKVLNSIKLYNETGL